jgi:hypothetical protein
MLDYYGVSTGSAWVMITMVIIMNSCKVIVMVVSVSIIAQNGSFSIHARPIVMIIHLVIVQVRLAFSIDFLRVLLIRLIFT